MMRGCSSIELCTALAMTFSCAVDGSRLSLKRLPVAVFFVVCAVVPTKGPNVNFRAVSTPSYWPEGKSWFAHRNFGPQFGNSRSMLKRRGRVSSLFWVRVCGHYGNIGPHKKPGY